MRPDPYQSYLESEILAADPVRLVELLYRGAIAAVSEARGFLEAGDIRARGGKISKATAILDELTHSLDRQKGGAIAQNLHALYEYMHYKLLEANLKQADAPLAEVERLLLTLLDAWANLPSTPASPPPALPNYQVVPEYEPISCLY